MRQLVLLALAALVPLTGAARVGKGALDEYGGSIPRLREPDSNDSWSYDEEEEKIIAKLQQVAYCEHENVRGWNCTVCSDPGVHGFEVQAQVRIFVGAIPLEICQYSGRRGEKSRAASPSPTHPPPLAFRHAFVVGYHMRRAISDIEVITSLFDRL